MNEDLWDIYGGVSEKGVVGDTTNLPQNWTAFQDTLWETLTFQRNVKPPPMGNAVGLALAIQCADVKARDIAKSEMRLWRRRAQQWVEVESRRHWLARMFATRPNEIHTWREFWRMVVLHLELTQNAFILKRIDRLGNVLELLPLPSGRVRPRISDAGRLFYEVFAGTEFDRAQIGDEYIVVPADRMIHLRGRMYDGLSGLSNMALGDPLFELLGAIGRFQTQLFGNDGRQPIVFESKDAVWGNDAQADAAFRRLKDQLTERVRKMNAYGDPILLEAGYTAKVIAQNARDAMTTEAYSAAVMQICGLMQTPPHKIYALSEVKYSNQESLNDQYANDCLIPIAGNVEERFKVDLLEEGEWADLYPEFDRMPLMAGDTKTMMDVVNKAIQTGLITINEGRERLPLALNPIPGGDVRLVPVNVAMVDANGNILQQAADGQPNNTGERDEDAEERGLRLVADNG